MTYLYLQPLSFILLSGLTLTLFLTGYLALIRDKRADLRILFVFLLAYTVFLASGWMIYTVVADWRVYLISILFLCIAVTVTGFVHFAYTFIANPFRREMRIVLTFLISGTVVYAAHVLAQCISHGQELNVNVTIVPIAAMFVDFWVFILLVRKMLRLERDSRAGGGGESGGRGVGAGPVRAASILRNAQSSEARAHRALLVVSGTHVVLRLEAVLWAVGFVPFSLHVALFYSIELVFVAMLVWVYVSYSPQPTTFRVKLVGLTLATTLLFIGIGGSYFYSAADLGTLGAHLLPEHTATRFVPRAEGGYRVLDKAPAIGPKTGREIMPHVAAGPRLSSIPVPLPFPFPFGGRLWDTAHISRFGTVSFGAAYLPNLSSDFRTLYLHQRTPRITPMLYNSSESIRGDRIMLAADSQSLSITWRDVRMSNSLYPGGLSKPSSFMLTLAKDGTIEWEYTNLNLHGIAELAPTGLDTAPLATYAGILPPSRSYRSDYLLQYRQLVHHTTLPILYLLLASTAFVIVFLPWLYGTSLVKPLSILLKGVNEVNAGRLDVHLPVHSSDELGTLTSTFNIMTRSLRQSERQLMEYAETLEQKVRERTAELNASLRHLQETQAQLIQSEKMASLGQLTAGIAHEIKNPLNFITNFSTLTKELIGEFRQAESESERSEILADILLNLARIHEHGKRADTIIRSMMVHARKGSDTRQATDINALLEEAAILSYHGIQAGLGEFDAVIERDFGSDLPEAVVNPQDISRCFFNIIHNGLYAAYEKAQALRDGKTPEGGSIPGSATTRFIPTIRISSSAGDGMIDIRIRDNGPGIPETVRDRIFQPFFTTKPTGEGTGLGLYLSYEIVIAHGGSLTMETGDGEYTEFRVSLPA